MSSKKVIHVFDVDGPVTDPVTKKANPYVVRWICNRLEAEETVVLMTGRAIKTLESMVLADVRESVSDLRAMQFLIVMGEKDANYGLYTYTELNDDLIFNVAYRQTVSVPYFLRKAANKIVTQMYSETMFIDHDKDAMWTAEMHSGCDIERFKADQHNLASLLNDLLNSEGLENEFHVDESAIATDIESKRLGKDAAMRTLLTLLFGMGIEGYEMVIFGDSPSDALMFTQAHESDVKAVFVYVGNGADIEGKTGLLGAYVTRTDLRYKLKNTEGTEAYLQEHFPI